MKDYYEILGVKRDSTLAEIKKQYKILARKSHPDKNPDNAEAMELFKSINEAYTTLSDDEKRKLYNAKTGISSQFNRFKHAFGQSNTAQSFSEDAHIIDKQRGSDLKGEFVLPFRESISGKKIDFPIKRLERCQTCDGSGILKTLKCDVCNGVGCKACKTTGIKTGTLCTTCKGKCRKRQESTIQLDVEAGVIDGQVITFKGQGNAGLGGGPNGDLKIKFNVLPDELGKFTRYGDDIYIIETIHAAKLVLGCTLMIETLDDQHEIKIPPGTIPGTRFRMKGKGVNNGDFYVRVDARIPLQPSEREIELWKELLELSGETIEIVEFNLK